jgi:ubiquinone/menaquinone biosynthesis C-methylase UbiE
VSQDPDPGTLVAGEYFLAVEGYAMIRHCVTDPSAARPRVDEMREILARFEEFPNSLAIPLTEHAVEDGYTAWAPHYDRPNPAIELEEPITRGMIAAVPPGDALDAACGTGRHAATLVELGHRVVGVDTTEAMLAVAREKVPAADFRSGRLEQLPVEDESVDLITCALALTHVERLEPVMREFVRVLRPGGQAILTDIHPVATMTGTIAAFPDRDITHGIPYVRNLTHQVSEYVTAFLDVGLSIIACVEPCVTDSVLQVFPSFPVLPDATRQAFLDTPYLLIWHLERPAPA